MTTSTIDFLRLQTREEHGEVERYLNISKFFAGDYSEEDYLQLLQRLYRGYQYSEDKLILTSSSYVKDILAEYYMPKSYALSRDIRSFGFMAPRSNVKQINSTDAFNLGVLYVLKGSEMGGKVIYKQLSSFGTHKPRSLEFFKAQNESSFNYREFQEVLNNAVYDQRMLNQALDGALWAFERFTLGTKKKQFFFTFRPN